MSQTSAKDRERATLAGADISSVVIPAVPLPNRRPARNSLCGTEYLAPILLSSHFVAGGPATCDFRGRQSRARISAHDALCEVGHGYLKKLQARSGLPFERRVLMHGAARCARHNGEPTPPPVATTAAGLRLPTMKGGDAQAAAARFLATSRLRSSTRGDSSLSLALSRKASSPPR